jgi:hypothetical protein
MRIIDADELKTKVEAMVEHRVNESDYDFGRNQAFDYVADILIDDAPTVDAVEVVRCKDCKYYKEYIPREDQSAMMCFCPCCLGGQGKKKPTDYCSYGERRDQERE